MAEKRNVIEIFNKEESLDLKSGVISFKTGLVDVLSPGQSGVLAIEGDNMDKIILNPFYDGGELVVKMRIIATPAKRYKVGDKIANLLIVG